MAYRTEIEKLEQRYAENPKQWFAALADAYRKQGEIDLAIEYVQKGIEDRPDYASAHIVLGRCYLDKETDDDAVRAFERVLELDAENIIALKSLEEIAERKGDVGKARHWLNQLLEVDPMNEEARESLARLGAEEEVEEPAPAPAVEEAVAAGAESFAEVASGSAGSDLTVSEDAVDASAVAVDPMTLDATLPMDAVPAAADEEIEVAIETIELETADADASSLPMGVPEAPVLAAADEETEAAIETIELETADADASSLPMGVPEASVPAAADEEIEVAIETIELETADADAGSLLAEVPEESVPAAADEETEVAIETIELETADADAGSLLAEVSGESVPAAADEEAEAAIEPIGLQAVDADASSLLAGVPGEAESAAEDEETTSAIEPIEFETVDADAEPVVDVELPEEPVGVEMPPIVEGQPLRASVPPTKEVEAVDLEAFRAADEMVTMPTPDAELDDEEEVAVPAEATVEAEWVEDVPRTTQIDAAELERLRTQDALAAGSPQETEPVEQAEVEAESPDEIEVEEPAPEAVAPEAGVEVTSAEAAPPDRESAVLPLIMPDDADGGETATQPEPEPVVTETMAEVYAKQGLLEQAREIYEVLVMQHGDDSRLKARLDELNEQANTAIQETRQSRFSVTATGGESAVTYLQRIFSHSGGVATDARTENVSAAAPEAPPVADPEMPLTPLEEAFADDSSDTPGDPTIPAADEVNLVSVFDGGAPAPPSTAAPSGGLDKTTDEPGSEDGVSFDEFYGSEPPQAPPEARGSSGDEEAPDDSDDDEDFKHWLKGLKT